jgi:hypothetical protein
MGRHTCGQDDAVFQGADTDVNRIADSERWRSAE